MAKKDDFTMLDNLPIECRDSDIKADDFKLVEIPEDSHEQKFQTKPTTFLKDSLKRFRKNKSSVVAAVILGILIALAIVVPMATKDEGPFDMHHTANSAFYNLQPKLFDSGTGFWDGTVKKEHIPVDAETGLPDPKYYNPEGIRDLVLTDEEYTNNVSIYAKDGYYHLGYYGSGTLSYFDVDSPASNAQLNLESDKLTLSQFVVVDEDLIVDYENGNTELGLPDGFVIGNTSLSFVFPGEETDTVIEIIEPSKTFNIGGSAGVATPEINLTELLISKLNENGITQRQFDDFYFRIHTEKAEDTEGNPNVCSLVKSLIITADDSCPKALKTYFGYTYMDGSKERSITGISFKSGCDATSRDEKVKWTSDKAIDGVLDLYAGKSRYGTFYFDSYEASLGKKVYDINLGTLIEYRDTYGWIDFEIQSIKVDDRYVPDPSVWIDVVILDEEHCPIVEPFEITDVHLGKPIDDEDVGTVTVTIYYYKYLGYEKMPSFLFGTDENGHDMFKYVFDGLRSSLILGFLTFAVCFLFGLLWGAVSGYFGGAVDIIMERITDILAGIPWIVLMTIIILKFNQTFWTFAIALCLTGWIGTAATTRTQFYRFRGREYVLASRTLGASDARLIAKHILPNAMGTIITSAVLMIPGVIFSEATISYLGLGFRGLSSLGVILSDNQKHIFSYPFQLIFPSVVIALIMISFNLFGNGLRDAINPSLKGEDE